MRPYQAQKERHDMDERAIALAAEIAAMEDEGSFFYNLAQALRDSLIAERGAE